MLIVCCIIVICAAHIWNVKGPCRHKETWWWNEEVAEAVREKKMKYRKWKREIQRRRGWSIRSVGRV